ncbi:hypothetical protein BGX23_001608 [Mortierella sp. AD031]|nr:hypothetical protein BGX23_001608 [Mortierella sp. AD031]
MDQNILQGALPLLSSVLGNNTVAGVMAVFNLALNTFNSAAETIDKHTPHDKYSYQQQHQQTTFNQRQTYNRQDGQQGQGQQQQQFASAIMSTLAMVFGTINEKFSSLTSSETPLTTYILVAFLSYIAFRIVYGFVSWIVRSVINLIKMSIMITVVTTILWFVLNVTSTSQDCDGSDGSTCDSQGFNTGGQNRAQDPISRVLGYAQTRFQAEYNRQQQFLQNHHPY